MDASIWDEPVVQDSPKRSEKNRPIDVIDIDDDDDVPQRPKKRPRQTLFYEDSDDDVNVPGPSNTEIVLKAPPPHDIDIDALFAGVDDDDDEISRPLPAIIDEEELTRQAEARFKKNPPPLSLHEILPSSSPARDQEGQNGRKGREKGKDDEKKVRRRQLRLDENLLLSPTGFPQLIKMTKDFRIKGKGHEVSLLTILLLVRFVLYICFLQAVDLDRLLRIYQYWTHQLYPKTTFTDTVERVEKLCHSRRMNVCSISITFPSWSYSF
jgi:replication fork protection complex subunit Csm3/Swi3